MRIIDDGRHFWTENKEERFGYWSNFTRLDHEKRDFFLIKAVMLLILMRLSGIRATLERGCLWDANCNKGEQNG